jgi:hypothetical protein
MDLGKLQLAGIGAAVPHTLESLQRRRNDDDKGLLYGGIAVGLFVGAAVSTYLWIQRSRSADVVGTPLTRAEALISSCESKIADIEHAIEELKEAAR